MIQFDLKFITSEDKEIVRVKGMVFKEEKPLSCAKLYKK